MEFIILAVLVALFNAWIAGKMGRSAFFMVYYIYFPGGGCNYCIGYPCNC